MQIKTFAATLFFALAAALPSASPETNEAQAATSNAEVDTATTPDVSMASTAEKANTNSDAPVSKKTWQADGHCEFKYRKLENCITACLFEAKFGPAKCRDAISIEGLRTGGCLPLRNTCECTCTY
ncbi:hypothetical protein PpBr36_04926 [Pyricularia pennisetigena]|uniref:hypothetical protein n=1 Tax=Pyricularia pennisetigena TaxID=1578925 RepID=UPI00114D8990|nr:hypothetical protein PpBr36_04926 [Pyricularia pennisetigena]TLS27259.1 hypothetical protein PpBr36_04926 [Pyricularia pennisetigena]